MTEQTTQPAPVAADDPFAPVGAAAVLQDSATAVYVSPGAKYQAPWVPPEPGIQKAHAELAYGLKRAEEYEEEQRAWAERCRVNYEEALVRVAGAVKDQEGYRQALALLPPEAATYGYGQTTPQDAPDLSFFAGSQVTGADDPQPPLTNNLTTPYDPDAPAVQGV